MSKTSAMKSGAAPRQSNKPSASASPLAGNAKWVLAGGAIVLAIAGLIIAARPDAVAQAPVAVAAPAPAPASGGAGRLTALRAKYNFGTISMAAGKVTHRYPISNAGDAPVTIRKVYTSCMCTTAAVVKNGKATDAYGMPGHTPIPTIDLPLAPSDRAFIEVVFDPAAHGPAGVGPIERAITVENSAGGPLELQFAALVTP